MPFFQTEQSVPANSSITNLLTGSIFEYAPYDSTILIGVTAAATGLVCNVTTGSDVVAEPFPPFVLTTFPVNPDQMVVADLVRAGERMVIAVRNGTGAAIVVRCTMQIVPTMMR